MIINSQFFITYYMGNSPLPLKTAPSGLTPSQRADYERFIQNIGAIYASQAPNGKIPKFWTKLTQTTDSLGNTKYSYIPHPDSDLEFLSSKSAYYFIVRDESSIPLKIPSVGGTLIGYTDTSSLPRVLPSSIPNTVLTSASGNYVFLTPTIDNLQPYEEYQYEFKGVDGNWPVTISPISGIIRPSASTGVINAKASFCLSSGDCGCEANVLDYHLDCPVSPLALMAEQTSNKYAIINLSITPTSYTGSEIFSDQFTILCKDCLPHPPSHTVEIVSASGSTLNVNNKFPIHYIFDNLEPHKTYSYEVETIQSNWPFYLSSVSGLITSSGVKDVVETFGAFCATSGECANNQPGVLPYVVQTGNLGYSSNSLMIPQTSFRLLLTDTNYPSIVNYSNIIALNCIDCKNSYVSVSIESKDLRNC